MIAQGSRPVANRPQHLPDYQAFYIVKKWLRTQIDASPSSTMSEARRHSFQAARSHGIPDTMPPDMQILHETMVIEKSGPELASRAWAYFLRIRNQRPA